MKGHEGWDDYAPYYDWENRQTVGRRDIAFWQRMSAPRDGPILELGCGTGRVAVPVARDGATVVGIDRSESMLARARMRVRRARLQSRVKLIRGDIRHLPFPTNHFELVMAPYGILQSLLDEKLLSATLKDVRRVLATQRHLWPRARRRSAGMGGVFEPRTLRGERGPHGKPIALSKA